MYAKEKNFEQLVAEKMKEHEKASRKTFQERLDRMIRDIRNELASGAWKEGDFLPSEKTYAKQYRLSNNTVRKGLDLLVEEGLIEKVPRVGNRVIGETAVTGDAVTLHFWCHSSFLQEAEIGELIAEFHRRHPGIRVQLHSENFNLNFYPWMKNVMDSGECDVFTMNCNSFDEFGLYGALDELEMMERNPVLYPFLSDLVAEGEQVKLQPFIFTPLVLCYNKAHFEEAGVLEPDSGWTWDTLRTEAKRLSIDNERSGFYFHYPSYNRWPLFLLQSGFRAERDEAGQAVIDLERLKRSLLACQTQLRFSQHRFSLFAAEDGGSAESLFFSGKTSMIMTTMMRMNHVQRPPDFEYDIASLPRGHEAVTLLLMAGLAIHARSPKKEEAKRFVDFLTSYDAQLLIRQKTVSIPANKAAAEWKGTETTYHPSRFHLYRDIIPTYRTFRDMQINKRSLEIFFKQSKLYLSGLETLDDAAARLKGLLEQDLRDVPYAHGALSLE